jgi:hypothetical protein
MNPTRRATPSGAPGKSKAAHQPTLNGRIDMNTTKTLIAAVLATATLASSGAAFSADWETVTRAADETVFLDLDSLRIAGPRIEAKVIHNYIQARNLGDDWYEHRSRVMTYRFDCGSEMLGFTGFEMKSGELGSGETVFGGTTGGDLFPASADPQDAKLISKVCNPANVARAERQDGLESRFARR